MTPDRRLDQLEPLVADVLQKVDRLIEGQGHLLEVAVRADQNAETAARGVAKLTVSIQKEFDELRAGQELLKSGLDQLGVSQGQLEARQEQLKVSQDQLNAGQEQLKAGQEAILQYLREKLP